MRRVTILHLVLGTALAAVGSSIALQVEAAELAWTSGVVVSGADGTLKLRRADGPVVPFVFSADCSFVFAQAIGRRDVLPGETVGVAAYVVDISPTATGFIGRSFVVADPDVPKVERRSLVEHFLAPFLVRASDKGLTIRGVIGALVGIRSGSVLVISDHLQDVSVKLGPEAFGYRLRRSQRQVLSADANVVVEYQMDGAARTVFIISDQAP